MLTILFMGITFFSYQLTEGEKTLYAGQENTKTDKKAEKLFRDMIISQIPPTLPVEIRLKDMNGREVSLSDFRGKIVFLNFWATWCGPCRIEMPSMERLYTKLKGKDFVMVAIDLQEPASKVKEFFKEYKLSFISLLDSEGEVASRFGIRVIPTTFILDKQGRIIGRALGPREWDGKESIALFEHLIR